MCFNFKSHRSPSQQSSQFPSLQNRHLLSHRKFSARRGEMNEQSSSAVKKEAKAILKKAQQQSRRAPLTDFTTRNSNTSNVSSSSSSASVEAPRGCLRFFISHSSCNANNPKNAPSKTPKSAPISRSKPRPLINGKNSFLKRSAKPQSRLKAEQNSSHSTPLNVNNQLKGTDSVSTPATAVKLVVGSNSELSDDGKQVGNRRRSKTPPIQSSLSPEIQCGSNIKTATPACYAAGHVLSGISDKRKCRPRGILTIGDDNDLANSFDGSLVVGNVENSGVSMFPTPVEASMCWLLSPCREDTRGGKENAGGFVAFKPLNSPSPPCSALAVALDMCNIGSNSTSTADNTSTTRHRRRRSSYLLSPSELSEIQECLDPPPVGKIAFSHSPEVTPSGKDGKPSDNTGNVCREHSPRSADSLASENVMQTPESCSSLERFDGHPKFSPDGSRMYHFDSELQSMREDVRRPSSSPNSHLSERDPGSLSFRFDSIVTSSQSIDLSHFQKVLDDRSLYLSNSTSSSQNISDSHMRISWREGLISRIFELDEFDSCRCVSDEEEGLSICASEPHKFCRTSATNIDSVNEPVVTNALKSAELLDADMVTKGKEKQVVSGAPYSCAESFSTDGGSLLCSDDSDWSLCYKNNLFEL